MHWTLIGYMLVLLLLLAYLQLIPFEGPIVIVLSVFLKQQYFFPSRNFSSSGCGHVDFLFTNESREKQKAGSWRNRHSCHTCRASLVRDVKETACRTHNGSAQGRVFETFKRRVLTDWTYSLLGSGVGSDGSMLEAWMKSHKSEVAIT